MAGVVLDCSVAVAWCFEDEATPELDALLDRVQHEGVVVPSFWISEAANVLLMAHRRGRINKETMRERVALLDMLPIETDDMASGAVWRSSVLTLADAEALTFYDAIYLELAIRRALPLASCAASRCAPPRCCRRAGRTSVNRRFIFRRYTGRAPLFAASDRLSIPRSDPN